MFVPLFPFPVPIPLIGEQLLPPNRPAAPLTEDAAGPVPPPPIPLGQKAGESKGVLPLVPGVQGPGGPWRIFRSIYAATFLYARK